MNPSDLAALAEQVRAGMEQHQVPGLAIGIWHDGEEWAAGFGATSQDHPLPVTPETLFQIGSTTKTVTATLVLRLVEAGKLELDAPVRRYLPELKLQDEDAARRVTLRHLLTHTGGWAGDLFVRTGDGDDALARYVAAMAGLRQLAPLGGLWSYNNAGFALAGRVVEAVTGRPYERACREWVLEPLGLSQSFFFPEEVMVHRFAVGHLLRGGQRTIARPWALARNANAVGGLSSTVRDQLRYARFHLGDGRNEQGERVLSPESMRLLQTPQVPAADGQEMGLSFFLRDVGGVRVVSHGGATNGQMSAFWFVPERDFACTILTNADHGRFLNNHLTAWVQKHLLGLEAPASGCRRGNRCRRGCGLERRDGRARVVRRTSYAVRCTRDALFPP
ncbi:serine hydrolase domain-containing protein, partial [Calidithermus terrae]|uniref:serine hydrolase domain-containing protein n=1 Tax=Calidithermus terrae TaxID=1408545 RepID=UPI0011C3A507